MGTVTTRPDGVLEYFGVGAAGGSLDSVLRDNSDGTYVQFTDAFGGRVYLSCSDPPIPAGAVMRSATSRIRWGSATGASAGINLSVTNGTYAIGTIPGASGGAGLTATTSSTTPIVTISNVGNLPNIAQGYLNGVALGFSPSGATTNARVYEAYLDFLYADAPSAPAVTGPVGVITTLTPTVGWVHQGGADAVTGQTVYRVVVYNTGTGGLVYDSGNVGGAAASQVLPSLALGSYVAYVYTAQTTNGVEQWSAPGTTTFTINVNPPTCAVTGPTGTVGTTTPTATWTHTPSPGATSGQTFYRVRAYATTDLATIRYDSGNVAGAANSAVIGPLDPTISSWRVVVNTAQTTGGVVQWSPDASRDFLLSVNPPLVDTVVATAANSTGSISVSVSHKATSPAWQSIDVEVSYDGGTTWSGLRGWTARAALADPSVATDYEAANGVPAQYRARASRVQTGQTLTGPWVLSNVVEWHNTGDEVWIKDPANPSHNMLVCTQLPDAVYERTLGVFRPVGSRYPVVVSDVMQAPAASVTVVTNTRAEEEAFLRLLAAPVVLVQSPEADWGWGSRYVAPGTVTESRTTPTSRKAVRLWNVALIEVAKPADTGFGAA